MRFAGRSTRKDERTQLSRSRCRRRVPPDPAPDRHRTRRRPPMSTVSAIGVTMDCPDPEVAATFWETFLDYRRRPARADSPYVTVERPDGSDGLALVTFQRVAEPKTAKAR